MIKLTKIDINPSSAVTHASTVEEYREDQERGTWGQFFEGKSPPIEYYVIGNLMRPIVIGEALFIERFNRNGIVKYGQMQTSTVEKIEKCEDITYITTANSLYRIEEIDGV